jgi:predicted nuclease of restriction endonuclease-like (RecB) superfamily
VRNSKATTDSSLKELRCQAPPGQSISIAYNPAIFTGAVTDNAGVACDDCFVSSMLTQLRLRQEWPQITDGKPMAKKRKSPAPRRGLAARKSGALVADLPDRLLSDIRSLIEQARQQVARTVNSAMVALYWRIGKRIREDVLHEQRAEYGEQIVQTVSGQLTLEYGQGYTEKGLRRMIQFAETFPDGQIVATLSRQLSWSHFVEIIPLDNPLKRDFYAEMCRIERWSVRTLRQKIDRFLFERTAVAKKPEELIRADLDALRDEDRLTPDLVFRDPYFLDFLGLTGSYSEKDVEQAILRELEAFILELGTDFAFIARQKRMTVDDEDYYLDLLFYHRKLRRLVAIDLKIGKFQAADKGQMELYLRWLEENEVQPGEEPPLGLVLCAGKTEGHVRLLRLKESGIHAAQYLTELPPQELLERKLHDAIRLARERLGRQAQEQASPASLPAPEKPAAGKTKKRKQIF